jgi:hypothetical protein
MNKPHPTATNTLKPKSSPAPGAATAIAARFGMVPTPLPYALGSPDAFMRGDRARNMPSGEKYFFTPQMVSRVCRRGIATHAIISSNS